MPITEQDLEAAKAMLRDEFKSGLDAALQELSVQIKESHNQVVEAAQATFDKALQSAKETIGAHDETLKAEAVALCQEAVAALMGAYATEQEEGLKQKVVTLSREAATEVNAATANEHKEACRKALESQLETTRKEMAPLLVTPVTPDGNDGVLLRIEKHHLYLDDLADRLGHPRMEAN